MPPSAASLLSSSVVWRAIYRLLLRPADTVVGVHERRTASMYALFILVLSVTGLNLGLWIFPLMQGADSFVENATFQAGSLAAVGFAVAYLGARTGRLRLAAYGVVSTAVVCAYLASRDAPEVLPFMISGVVIATVSLPLKASVFFAALVALGPLVLAAHQDIDYASLAYVQGLNVMMPALLILVAWYRQWIEREAQEGNARLAALVRDSPDAIVWLDNKGIVRMCNPAFESLTGREAHELLGSNIATVGLDANDFAAREAHRPHIRQLTSARGATRQVECVHRAATDSRYGEGTQLIVRDIEERQRVQEHQARLESELAEARRLESIGRLAGGIAHDLNNQLTVMLGNAQLLARTAESNETTAIIAAADHSARLVGQLLTFARGEESHAENLDAAQRVRDLQPVLRTLVRDDIELRVEIPSDQELALFIDATHFEQLVINLVANASEAMPNGGSLRVELRELQAHGAQADAPCIELSVADEGVGIEKAVLEHMFEPFFTTKSHGTGLGLATVHGIVTKAGGHIEAESHLGVGTTFRVRLPKGHRAAASKMPSSDAVASELFGLSVLIVDDQLSVATLTARLLSELGMQAQIASSGEAALRLFESEPTRFALLISDVIMPEMNGPELVRRARALAPKLCVLLVSGYPFSEDLSGEHFLRKPFAAQSLRTAVRRALTECATSEAS